MPLVRVFWNLGTIVLWVDLGPVEDRNAGPLLLLKKINLTAPPGKENEEMNPSPIQSVCVFCASSRKAHPAYYRAAALLGETLALHHITIRYGGGAVGLMGHLAAGALHRRGTVIGIIPDFMQKLEWGHPGISELIVVPSMPERKVLMREGTDAVIALPGGTGTLDELLEVITLKRLGRYPNPVILVNVADFFNPFLEFYDKMIAERFLDRRHREMITVADGPAAVIAAIQSTPAWKAGLRHAPSADRMPAPLKTTPIKSVGAKNPL